MENVILLPTREAITAATKDLEERTQIVSKRQSKKRVAKEKELCQMLEEYLESLPETVELQALYEEQRTIAAQEHERLLAEMRDNVGLMRSGELGRGILLPLQEGRWTRLIRVSDSDQAKKRFENVLKINVPRLEAIEYHEPLCRVYESGYYNGGCTVFPATANPEDIKSLDYFQLVETQWPEPDFAEKKETFCRLIDGSKQHSTLPAAAWARLFDTEEFEQVVQPGNQFLQTRKSWQYLTHSGKETASVGIWLCCLPSGRWAVLKGDAQNEWLRGPERHLLGVVDHYSATIDFDEGEGNTKLLIVKAELDSATGDEAEFLSAHVEGFGGRK